MIISDIVALAKQGYKPADIKEIIALADESKGTEKGSTEPQEEPEESADVSPAPVQAADPEDDAPEDDAVDYKKLYEESRKALKDLQEKNTHAPAPSSEQPDVLADIVRGFM